MRRTHPARAVWKGRGYVPRTLPTTCGKVEDVSHTPYQLNMREMVRTVQYFHALLVVMAFDIPVSTTWECFLNLDSLDKVRHFFRDSKFVVLALMVHSSQLMVKKKVSE